MRVLGVSLGHDSNVCLVEDGKVVRYMAEERFDRIKSGVNNAFDSMRYCLEGIGLEGIDHITISSGLVKAVLSHYETLMKNEGRLGVPIPIRDRGYQVNKHTVTDHHECHAGSSYFTSGLDNALVVTIDGIGEETTHSVYLAEGRKMKPMYYVKLNGIYQRGQDGVFREHRFKKLKILSWGWFYGMVTEALGWRMVCDEGKTMGLAPYGEPSVIPDKEIRKYMFKESPQGFYHNAGKVYYHFGGSLDYEKLAQKYGRENLAASAQKKVEDKVVLFIKRWLKRTGQRNLCTAGGLFLNVKLNQRIVEECDLDNYWPFPMASDCGLSVGAALVEYHKNAITEFKPWRMEHLYFGTGYSNEEIENVLRRNKLSYRPYDVSYVARKLAQNKIVGWFQGRMEGGPRALGGRSILMSPLKAENKDIINSCVKFREGFRPFCPSVTEEAADKYFDGGGEFMITACNVKTQDIPAVTHVDGTARPQIVKQSANPKFHALIDAFGKESGHPVLLNTSMNIMGEPIVRTPEEAIRCFYGVGMDLLVLGDFVLEKMGGEPK